MINEDVVRLFSDKFKKLVDDIDTSINEYHTNIRNLVTDKNSLSELNGRIKQSHPELYQSVRGVPGIVKWKNDFRRAMDFNSAFTDNNSNALMLAYGNNSDMGSNAKSTSDDSITKLDGLFTREDITDVSLMHVFDDSFTEEDVDSNYANETNSNAGVSNTGSVESTGRLSAPSRNHDEWKKYYYLLQNALKRYNGMDGVLKASKDLSMDSLERRQLLQLISWSEDQKQQCGDLLPEHVELMNSLSVRFHWKWDGFDALSEPRGGFSLDVSTMAGSANRKQYSSSSPPHAASTHEDTSFALPSRHTIQYTDADTSDQVSITTTSRAEPRSSARKAATTKKAPRKSTAASLNAANKAEIRREQKEWNEHFDLLLEYGKNHKDYQVPADYVVRDKLGNDKQLGMWLGIQLALMGVYQTEAPRWYDKLAKLMETGKLWLQQEQENSSSSSNCNSKEESVSKTNEDSGAGDSAEPLHSTVTTPHSPVSSTDHTLSGSKRRVESSEDITVGSGKRVTQKPPTVTVSLKDKDLYQKPQSSSSSSRGSDAASDASVFSLKPPALGARHSRITRGVGGHGVLAAASAPSSRSSRDDAAVKEIAAVARADGYTGSTADSSGTSVGAASSMEEDSDAAVVRAAGSVHAGGCSISPDRPNSVSVASGLQTCTLKPIKTEPSDDTSSLSLSPHRYVAILYSNSSHASNSDTLDGTLLLGVGQVIPSADEELTVQVKLLLRRDLTQPLCRCYREDYTSLAVVQQVPVGDLILDNLHTLLDERAGQHGYPLVLTAESYYRLQHWYTNILPEEVRQCVK